VDDAEVHPRYSISVQVVLRVWNSRCDREPKPTSLREQGDSADLIGRVRDRPSQSDPEFWVALGHGQAHPLSRQLKGPVVEAHRNKGALAPWEPGFLTSSTALGRLNQALD
jgi:hypothetical protein